MDDDEPVTREKLLAMGATILGPQKYSFPQGVTVIVVEGDLLVWKKCRGEILVRLLVPKDAKRSNATGRKCRAEFADVIEIIGAESAVSKHDDSVTYRVGQRVTCHRWDENRWKECSGGIHFFLTREEAEAY